MLSSTSLFYFGCYLAWPFGIWQRKGSKAQIRKPSRPVLMCVGLKRGLCQLTAGDRYRCHYPVFMPACKATGRERGVSFRHASLALIVLSFIRSRFCLCSSSFERIVLNRFYFCRLAKTDGHPSSSRALLPCLVLARRLPARGLPG